jgi:hypothetical protein
VQAIKAVGGVIIQMHRDAEGLTGVAATHTSEVERDSPEFQALVDHHIHNNGSLEELDQMVQHLGGSLSTQSG